MKQVSLDELYRMTAYIYSEQNAIRPVATTFAHFVEVCGMLTVHDRKKKKEGLNFVDALCKALGWYFPLLAKLRVRSVEELIYRKYPYVCPYCRKAPHEDLICKTVRGTASTVDHSSLRDSYESNKTRMPQTLDEWQSMFNAIYPRSPSDNARSTLGLFEELGELAEAVRVFERYPKYFVGEAADVFSYLMGMANEYNLREELDNRRPISFQEEYLKRFPGVCIGCGHRICVCPSIPASTVGRMSKELEIGNHSLFFERTDDVMITDGWAAASSVLQSIGGYPKLAERFPADRGDANAALIVLCIKLAAAVEKTNSALADRFHSAAVELGTTPADAGSKRSNDLLSGELLSALREGWRSLMATESLDQLELKKNSLAFDLGISLSKIRILFVYPSPSDQDPLRSSSELRAIKESIRHANRESDIEIDDLPASTVDDLRRALLDNRYEIVHFAGHADAESAVFEDTEGVSMSVSLQSMGDALKRYPIKCLILNSCDALSRFSAPIAEYTIGMESTLTNGTAIEFARGFYDAICRGKDIDFAVDEGKHSASLKGLEPPKIKIIRKQEAH